MRSGLYFGIASDNIKKNARLYIPRILAEAGLLGCFYILLQLALDDRLDSALGGSYLPVFMTFGAVVIGILSLIIILYVNSFLMKQRKNEYGLYNVLGLEKKHVVRILFTESAFTSLISVILGSGFGILFYKFASLIICKLLHVDVVAGFYFLKFTTVLIAAGIFVVLDLFAFVINAATVRRLKLVELLAGRHTGEKEPKVKWFMLILGILTTGAGYIIALTTKSPLMVIFILFAAVILVIIGTYCLFITGTTFILKCLKKNKRYYYDKKHMPAVSGLLFRMKQNAVGLASIAVLATGVLVMISTTVSLYSGVQDTMDTNYQKQLYLCGYYEDDGKMVQMPSEDLYGCVADAADELNIEIKDHEIQQYLDVSYLWRDGALLTKTEVEGGWNTEELTGVMYITEQTYRELRGRKVSLFDKDDLNLGKNEIAVCRVATTVNNYTDLGGSLKINGQDYSIVRTLEYFPIENTMGTVVNVIGIVVSDTEVLDDIFAAQKEAYGEFASMYTDRVGVEFEDEDAVFAVGSELNEAVERNVSELFPSKRDFKLDSKWDSLSNVLNMYGTFLFLGILLGAVCLFTTILIIYYKQISEGYEDRERFQIMQKIGMEEKEVKKTIGSQLVLQFFLPLVTAGIHTAVAFPILLKLLKILMLTNTTLFLVCTLITFAVFAAVYACVYLLTKKTYYKIVR